MIGCNGKSFCYDIIISIVVKFLTEESGLTSNNAG